MFTTNGIEFVQMRAFLQRFLILYVTFIGLAVGALDASYGLLSPSERRAALTQYIDLQFPDNKGSYPLAIILPGCMGWHPHHDRWRKELLKREFAVLHVDSFAARGLNQPTILRRDVCSGKTATGDERAGDIASVLPEVWKNKRIHEEKTVIMGWSHGGWTALDLLASLESRISLPNLTQLPVLEVHNIRAAILYYPWCGPGGLNWTGYLPTNLPGYLFHGSRDAITSPKECKRRIKRASKNGSRIEFVELKGAFHWFDNHAAEFFDQKSHSIAFSRAIKLIKRVKNNKNNYPDDPANLTSPSGSDSLLDLFDDINEP